MAITDLTNTKWRFNDTVYWTENADNLALGYDNFSVSLNFRIEGGNVNYHTLFAVSDGNQPPTDLDRMTYRYASTTGGDIEITVYYGSSATWITSDGGDKTIIITGGTDATNSSFIAWLEQNATQLEYSVDLQIDYGSSSISVESPYTLDTSGKLMSSNVVITSLGGSSTPTFTNIGTTTSDVSGAYVTSGSDNYYVSSITVPSAKTLTIANTGTTNINGGNADKGVQVNGHTAIVDTYTVTDSSGDLITANPAFDGGALMIAGSASASATNATLTTTNTSGVVVTASGSATPQRGSVLYNGAVSGWVSKADNTEALAADTGSSTALTDVTYYIDSITVPSNKTLTVNTVNGILNVNGGATNGGVQVKANKVAVVDGFTVTYGTTTTVNSITYYAGDLKVPTYNSSSTSLEYPDPGIFSSAAGTTTMSITGNVTKINNLTVKDVNAVTGSGTASSSYSNTYLAKWSSSTALTTGPRVTISSTTPSNPSAGDIWYQI